MNGLSGCLSTMPLRDVVSYLAQRKLSGTLYCRRGDSELRVELNCGVAVSVQEQPEGPLLPAVTGAGADSACGPPPLPPLAGWAEGSFDFIPESVNASPEPAAPQTAATSPTGDALRLLAASPQAPVAPCLSEDFAPTFRGEVGKRLAARGRGKRFPKDLRQRAVAYYWARTQQGSFLSEVSRELGLPPPTLRRWVLDIPEATGMARRPTWAAPAEGWVAETYQPVLVGPGGLRVEGLNVATLVELLRGLEVQASNPLPTPRTQPS